MKKTMPRKAKKTYIFDSATIGKSPWVMALPNGKVISGGGWKKYKKTATDSRAR